VTPLLVVAGALVGAPLRLLVTRLAARGGRDPARGSP
jgi:CrcB protein